MLKKSFLAALLSTFLAGAASAAVNVNINIGTPLPELVLSQPPALAVVSGTYVYVAPEVQASLVFYQDNWYRQHGGGWYASINYNGPWKAVSAPPAALVNLPANYRAVPPGHEHMPYGQVKDNWRTWERDRHWDRSAKRDEGGHHEKRDKHDKYKKKHHDDERGRDRDDRDGDHDRDRERHKHDD